MEYKQNIIRDIEDIEKTLLKFFKYSNAKKVEKIIKLFLSKEKVLCQCNNNYDGYISYLFYGPETNIAFKIVLDKGSDNYLDNYLQFSYDSRCSLFIRKGIINILNEKDLRKIIREYPVLFSLIEDSVKVYENEPINLKESKIEGLLYMRLKADEFIKGE